METLILGQDLGMGSNKLYGSQGGLVLQSVVAAVTGQAVGSLLGFRTQKPPLKLYLDGTMFYVGPGAADWGQVIENLDYDRLNGVPETRAVVYANLTRYLQQMNVTQAYMNLIVGLPLEPLSGPEAQTNADAVRAWLRGDHAWEADGQRYHVVVNEAKVTSQPSGALFDYLLDEDGQFIPERKGHLNQEVGILSLGFNTIEVLTVRDRTPVQAMTGGRTAGVRRLLELVNTAGWYSMGELDSQLRAGTLDVKSALPVWAREVGGHIEKIWGQRWRRFARIIAVGGGALLLREHLVERFNGRVFIPDDPVLSIARGLYKLGRQQANRRAKA